jgi:surfactin synthase thioesterase subunit
MGVKGDIYVDEEPTNKKRVTSVLTEKWRCCIKRRMRIAVVGCHYFINKSIIHFIKRHKNKIRERRMASAPASEKHFLSKSS